MRKSSNFKRVLFYAIAFLFTVTVSVSCKDNNEKKVSKVEVTLQIPGNEALKATVSDKSVLRFKVDNTLYGVAISDLDVEKKEATIAFLEVDELKDGIKLVPNDKIKVVADKSGATSLAVENNLGAFEVKLNGFSVGSLDVNAAAGSCCVTCGNTTACGCAVSMSCGSCCSDPCCGSGSVTLPTGEPGLPDFEYFR